MYALFCYSLLTKPALRQYDIVANKRNNIDVDKFDYFVRDGHALGLKIQFNMLRLMQMSKVHTTHT